jgi:alpha-L-rhamnosidase
MILSEDSTRQTPKGFIASTYYVHCLDMLKRFAVLSNHSEDTLAYVRLHDAMIKRINHKYLDTLNGYYANNTITSNLLALSFNIVPASYRKKVAHNIVEVSANKFDNHLGTGLIGNQWLMRGLTDNGYADVAFKIATNTTYPSWGYMMENGSTTIWELWNGNTANPAMNSGNHVMLLGDLLIWYYEDLAGIKSIEPGFKKIEMKPLIQNSLTYVDATHESSYGKIKSSWKKNSNTFDWKIAIPANCSADVYIPSASQPSIKEGGKYFEAGKYLRKDKGYFVYELGSGNYHFTSNLKN